MLITGATMGLTIDQLKDRIVVLLANCGEPMMDTDIIGQFPDVPSQFTKRAMLALVREKLPIVSLVRKAGSVWYEFSGDESDSNLAQARIESVKNSIDVKPQRRSYKKSAAKPPAKSVKKAKIAAKPPSLEDHELAIDLIDESSKSKKHEISKDIVQMVADAIGLDEENVVVPFLLQDDLPDLDIEEIEHALHFLTEKKVLIENTAVDLDDVAWSTTETSREKFNDIEWKSPSLNQSKESEPTDHKSNSEVSGDDSFDLGMFLDKASKALGISSEDNIKSQMTCVLRAIESQQNELEIARASLNRIKTIVSD